MKVKVSEASGPALDWMVRYAQNGRPPIDYVPNRDNFSTCWNKGGPLIELEKIELKVLADSVHTDAHPTFKFGDQWEANIWPDERDLIEYCGPTPLITAMRCYVASKLGEEVDVPEELL